MTTYTAHVNRAATGLAPNVVTYSRHFLTQAIAKGFTAEQIMSAVAEPYKVTPVTRHPGQSRYCGAGVAVVIDSSTLTAITVYLDGVVTDMRDDQRHDAAALSSRRLAGVR